jgi:hypothetical protein
MISKRNLSSTGAKTPLAPIQPSIPVSRHLYNTVQSLLACSAALRHLPIMADVQKNNKFVTELNPEGIKP